MRPGFLWLLQERISDSTTPDALFALICSATSRVRLGFMPRRS